MQRCRDNKDETLAELWIAWDSVWKNKFDFNANMEKSFLEQS